VKITKMNKTKTKTGEHKKAQEQSRVSEVNEMDRNEMQNSM